ncbi:MAG: hypothetical protein ACLR1T_14865 [Evtepia gabavorous]
MGWGTPFPSPPMRFSPSIPLLTARYGIALAFLLLVFGRRIWRGLKVCSPRDWLLPSLCMGGAYVANNIALELTAATSVAFLRSLSTVMTPLWPWLSTAASLEKHIPVQLLVLVGLYLLCGLGGLSGFGLGEVFPSSPLFCWPGPDFWRARPGPGGPRHPHHPPDRRLSPHGPLLCALAFDQGIHLGAATPSVWMSILYLALFCTVAGYLLQNAALGCSPPAPWPCSSVSAL